MSNEIKFTDEELKKVQDIKEQYNKLTVQLGQIELDRNLLDEQRKVLTTEYSNLRDMEMEFAKGLSNKYGVGSLNLQTGVFVPTE